MSLPGCAAIPAPYRERGQMAYETGKRIVDMVHEDLHALEDHDARGLRERHRRAPRRSAPRPTARRTSSPSPAISASSSTTRIGRQHRLRDPAAGELHAGRRISRRSASSRRRRAGGDGRAACATERSTASALTVTGKTMGAEPAGGAAGRPRGDPHLRQIRSKQQAGFAVLSGNLFDIAIMKTSVISPEFRKQLSASGRATRTPSRARAIVFDGPEDYHHRINDPKLADRREQHPVHPQLRAGRLSRRGRSGEHAAARRAGAGRHRLRCPASATAGRAAPRPARRSSTPRRKRRSAAGWRCSRPATRSASTSNKRRADILISDDELRRRARRVEAACSSRARRPGRRSTAQVRRPARQRRVPRLRGGLSEDRRALRRAPQQPLNRRQDSSTHTQR